MHGPRAFDEREQQGICARRARDLRAHGHVDGAGPAHIARDLRARHHPHGPHADHTAGLDPVPDHGRALAQVRHHARPFLAGIHRHTTPQAQRTVRKQHHVRHAQAPRETHGDARATVG
jgi:hypothetical protein